MREVKRLLDPGGAAQPRRAAERGPGAPPARTSRSPPTVEAEVDRCVECGYCEPVCPSKDLTTTPRQRIVLRRELSAAPSWPATRALVRELDRDYGYDGRRHLRRRRHVPDRLPRRINTGDLVKRLRAERGGPVDAAGWDARRPGTGTPPPGRAAIALTAAKALPPRGGPASRAAAVAARRRPRPRYDARPARGGTARAPAPGAATRSRCTCRPASARCSARPTASRGVREAFLALCDRAGVPVTVPDGIGAMCCGTPWTSKGLHGRLRAP